MGARNITLRKHEQVNSANLIPVKAILADNKMSLTLIIA